MIAVACDHGGYVLKKEILKHLEERGLEYKDLGCDSEEAVDYPIYARKVTSAITSGECERGILICGTGIGISLAANEMKGIRCALPQDIYATEKTREHNDANFMALGGRVEYKDDVLKMVDAFLTVPFSGDERHMRRIEKLMALEGK